MNSTANTFRTCGKTMLMATLLLASAPAIAATYWLQAETLNVTMPDGNIVPMWGFANCTDATYTVCDPATVPGPALNVPAGDTTGLTVNLKNTLTKPVSLVINGQSLAVGSTPVWTDGTSGPRTNRTQRVRSFTHEAAPNGGEATYSWPVTKTGTYLYQSGTHPQVQVQMGLYGALTHDAAAGQPYTGSATYDSALTLLFSEIDPLLHVAVAGGTYGTVDGPTSTMDYNPKYYLINGKAFESGDLPLAAYTEGDTVLLRLLNAGLRERAPMISNGYMSVIAEDGNLYPWEANPRQQYSVFLPPAKTLDALYVAKGVAGQDARIAIFDRRLGLTTNVALDGGMMGFLEITVPAVP